MGTLSDERAVTCLSPWIFSATMLQNARRDAARTTQNFTPALRLSAAALFRRVTKLG